MMIEVNGPKLTEMLGPGSRASVPSFPQTWPCGDGVREIETTSVNNSVHKQNGEW
jgi:hypothetical protein